MSNGVRPRSESIAGNDEWTISRCASGCVHLRTANVSIAFSTTEFCRFVQLLGEAYVRISVHEAVKTKELH